MGQVYSDFNKVISSVELDIVRATSTALGRLLYLP